jgi:hypothetical protein
VKRKRSLLRAPPFDGLEIGLAAAFAGNVRPWRDASVNSRSLRMNTLQEDHRSLGWEVVW